MKRKQILSGWRYWQKVEKLHFQEEVITTYFIREALTIDPCKSKSVAISFCIINDSLSRTYSISPECIWTMEKKTTWDDIPCSLTCWLIISTDSYFRCHYFHGLSYLILGPSVTLQGIVISLPVFNRGLKILQEALMGAFKRNIYGAADHQCSWWSTVYALPARL